MLALVLHELIRSKFFVLVIQVLGLVECCRTQLDGRVGTLFRDLIVLKQSLRLLVSFDVLLQFALLGVAVVVFLGLSDLLVLFF